MAQQYSRQSSFIDGDTITAALFNDEYNQLDNAFNYSSTDVNATGHRHDGTAGQGGNIPVIGSIDFKNKIEIDDTNDRWGIWVDVSGTSVEQIRVQDGAVLPVTNNDIDLGSVSNQFKDLYIDGTASIDTLTIDSTATIAGASVLSSTLNVQGATDLDSTLNVDGAAGLGSTLNVVGAATLNSGLNVTGQTILYSGLLGFGSVVLDSTLAVNGAVDMNSTFNADGATTLGSTVNVTGATVLASTLNVQGATDLDTTLNVDGATTLNTTLDVTGNTTIGGNLTVTGDATINGNLTFGDAATDTVSFSADIDSSIIPETDDAFDLGSATQQWKDLYIDGTANIDNLIADSVDVNGGSIDGTAIGVSSASTVNTTALSLNGVAVTATSPELNVMDGNTTASSITIANTDSFVYNDGGTMLQVSVDAVDDYYSATTKTLTNKSISADTNTITELEVDNLKSGVLDTDINSVAGTHTTVPSALAVKTYVDNVAAAQNEASEITYSNTTSGLTATTTQSAIDEVEGRLDTAETNITTNTTNIEVARAEAVAFAIALG